MSDRVQWLINDIKAGKQDIESKYRETPFYFNAEDVENQTIMAHIKNTNDYDFMLDGSTGVNIDLHDMKQQKYTRSPKDAVYMNNLYWQKRAKQM